MYEEPTELECVECAYCKTVYPCECGGNEGIPDIDPIHANTGVRFAMSETQALLYNAENWKDGLSLIFMCDDSYELVHDAIQLLAVYG